MNTKTYTIGGTSVLNGVKTFRFANGRLNLRVNTLRHKEHEDINLVELPKPMTRSEVIAMMSKQGVDAILPTRAVDKSKKPAEQLAAEATVSREMEALQKRAANKARREQAARDAAAAQEADARKRARDAKRADKAGQRLSA